MSDHEKSNDEMSSDEEEEMASYYEPHNPNLPVDSMLEDHDGYFGTDDEKEDRRFQREYGGDQEYGGDEGRNQDWEEMGLPHDPTRPPPEAYEYDEYSVLEGLEEDVRFGGSNDRVCSICHESGGTYHKLIFTACDHVYHRGCLEKQGHSGTHCPCKKGIGKSNGGIGGPGTSNA